MAKDRYILMQKEYQHNSKFHEYVDKYSKDRGIPISIALQHEVVRQVFLRYTDL